MTITDDYTLETFAKDFLNEESSIIDEVKSRKSYQDLSDDFERRCYLDNELRTFYKDVIHQMREKTVFDDKKGEKGVRLGKITVIPNYMKSSYFPRLKQKGAKTFVLGECFTDYQSFLRTHFKDLVIEKIRKFGEFLAVGQKYPFGFITEEIVEEGYLGFDQLDDGEHNPLGDSNDIIEEIQVDKYEQSITLRISNIKVKAMIEFDTEAMKYLVDVGGYKFYYMWSDNGK